jgi:hypothetical protein
MTRELPARLVFAQARLPRETLAFQSCAKNSPVSMAAGAAIR